MKVLLVADCVGGVWTYSLDLAEELTRRGDEVFLAVMGRDVDVDQRDEISRLDLYGWEARPYALEWMADAEDDLDAAADWLLDLAHVHEVDVVHLNVFAPADLRWHRPVVLVAHSDVVTWWRAVKGTDPPAEWERYAARVARALDAADHVVAPTQAMLASLAEAYSFTTAASVIHNGSLPDVVATRKEPLLVSVGRLWDEAKNLETASVAAEGVGWPFVAVGEGHGREGAGRLPPAEVRKLLARASVFVEPARYEPFGLAALEAGLAGCALVLGDIPSLREVWGDAAIFTAPEDTAELHATLVRLVQEPESLASAQRAARRRATRYTVPRMVDAYHALYGAILNDRRVTSGGRR